MAKVNITVGNQAVATIREKLPINVMAEVVEASYQRIKKESFKKNDGETVPEREATFAVLNVVLPESAEPTKVYTVELGCGEHLVPSEDGTYLDDVMAKTDKQKKLSTNCGWATFKNSLLTAGAENGLFTEAEDAKVSDNIKALVGTRYQTGVMVKDGGPAIGKYDAAIATLVYNFGKQNVEEDMQAVIANVQSILSTVDVKVGLAVNELVGKLKLTAAQFELAKQCFANEEWIKSAEGKAFNRTVTGRYIKV